MIETMSRERSVEAVGHGDHLCFLFADDAEKRRVATRYMADGLALGERVLYFADQSRPETVREWLRSAGVDVEEFASSRVGASLPLRRVGTADEVAKMIVVLVSDVGSWVTGGGVSIDGGAAMGVVGG